MSRILVYTLVFTAGCLLAGCEEHYISILKEDTRAYVDFLPGSYWIYENDSTGEIDSLWVSDYDRDWYISDGSDRIVEAEYLSITRTRSRDFTTFRERFKGFSNDAIGEIWMSEGFGMSLFWPFVASEETDKPVTFLGRFPQLNINGHTFSNAIGFRNTVFQLIPSGNDTAEFYYAKNIGLVHWEILNTDTSWTLIGYFVKRG